MRISIAMAAVLASCALAASAQDMGDLEGTAVRPVDIYLYSATKGINQRVETRLVAPGIKLLSLNDPWGKTLCSGTVDATTKNWVFNNLRCPSLDIDIKSIELKENFRWGVMRHSIAKTELPNGLTVGVFLHLNGETQWVSETRIPPEKVQSLYGDFPNWKLP